MVLSFAAGAAPPVVALYGSAKIIVCLRKAPAPNGYGAWMMPFGFLGHNRVEVGKMDIKQKKELSELYKFRRPETGVISYRCKATGDVFLDISRDTKASFNSTNMKLCANWHPNKQLQDLWNEYGQESFELSVIEVLKYDGSVKDHTVELEDNKIASNCESRGKESPAAKEVRAWTVQK